MVEYLEGKKFLKLIRWNDGVLLQYHAWIQWALLNDSFDKCL